MCGFKSIFFVFLNTVVFIAPLVLIAPLNVMLRQVIRIPPDPQDAAVFEDRAAKVLLRGLDAFIIR